MLEPLDPEEARDMYLASREGEVSDLTLTNHEYRLNHLVRWCDEKGITNLNELSGRDLHRYKLWRKRDGDLNKVTLKTQMDTLRVFIRWCESIDGVEENLSEKVQSPSLGKHEDEREVTLSADRAEDILEYLSKFKYATRKHATFSFLWHTGARVGAAVAIDLDDYNPEDQRIEVYHRPETGTPLKNHEEGGRYIHLSGEVCTVIDDYINHHRYEVTDDYGRQPLFTTKNSRVNTEGIRKDMYRITQPCFYSDSCPDSREMEDCDATYYQYAYQCPFSLSPHPIRRGSITYHLTNDVPKEVVSGRMNVSGDVLDKHYDMRTEEERMQNRREYLNNI